MSGEQFIDYRRKPSTERYDPAVEAAKQARADAAQARAMREQEKLQAQRARLAKADEILNELARVALSMNVDLDSRLKAANIYLDRVVPRQKSVEFTGEVGVQVEHRAYIAPGERIMSLSFDEALDDARRRLEHYDAQRAVAQVDAPVLVEARRGDDDE